MDTKKNYKTFVSCSGGFLEHIIEYDSGARICIPINSDGSVKWFDDRKLTKTVDRCCHLA